MPSEKMSRQNTFLFYVIVTVTFLTIAAMLTVMITKNVVLSHNSLIETQIISQKLNRWQMLMDTIPGGILVLDSDGVVIYTNPGFAELSGYRQYEIVGYEFLKFVPDEYKQDHRERWSDPNMAKEFGGSTLCLPEGQLSKKSGDVINLRITIRRTKIGAKVEWLVFFDPRNL